VPRDRMPEACTGYRNERLFLACRPRANTSCRLSGMLAEAIDTRQVNGNDSGCPLSRLCAEFPAPSAPDTPRPVTSLITTSITTINKTL
jgi:hypothetical protein